MKKSVTLLLLSILLMIPCAFAYGVTFYNPPMNPQFGRVYDFLYENTPYEIKIDKSDIAITNIEFIISRDVQNGGITVYNLFSTPDFFPEVPTEDSYEINEVKYSGFVPFDVKSFVYNFKVKKDWVKNQSFSRLAISLHIYDRVLEQWEVVPTEITGEDDSFVFFKAKAKAVHYLFIGKSLSDDTEYPAEPEEIEEIEQVAESEEKEVVTSDVSDILESEITPVKLGEQVEPFVSQPSEAETAKTQETQKPASVEEPKEKKLTAAFIFILLIIILVVVYVVFGKKKGKTSVDKELQNYIKESLSRGKSKTEVRKRLFDVGWHPDRIDKALAKHSDKGGAGRHVEKIKAFIKKPLKKTKKHVKAKKK